MAMDRTGISSLQSGAGEITYSGNQGPKSPDQQLMAQADPMIVEMYEQYVFEMEEQGLQPMPFRDFMQQIMAESKMAKGGRAGYQGGHLVRPPGITDEEWYRIMYGLKGPRPLSSQSPYLSVHAYGGLANPTYTQKRKQNLANGGVAGLKNRPGYFLGGVGDFFGGIKDKIVDDIIPNEIKENPMLSAAVLGGAANQWDLIPGDMSSQNWIGELLSKIPGTGEGTIDMVLGGERKADQIGLGEAIKNVGTSIGNVLTGNPVKQAENQTVNSISNLLSNYFGQGQGTTQSGIINALLGNTNLGTSLSNIFGADQETGSIPFGLNWANLPEGLRPYIRKEIKEAVPGREGYWKQTGRPDENIFVQPQAAQAAEYEHRLNPVYPISMGLAAGEFARRNPGPTLPTDTAIGARNIDMASAIGGDNLRFKLNPSVAAAQGGRIGYAGGGTWGIDTARSVWNGLSEKDKVPYEDFVDFFLNGPWGSNPVRTGKDKLAQGGRIGAQEGGPMDQENMLMAGGGDRGWRAQMLAEDLAEEQYGKEFYDLTQEQQFEIYTMALDMIDTRGMASGGRVAAQEGGLMDLGGMEKDYRNEGGFVPIGGQERADDVPARLSKNEFVFTADAVRSAGGGDIDKGADVMENVMEHLEQGGQISEDSQGLEGARNMFATAQRLEGVM